MIINIEHVTWRREGLTLLKDVNWQVATGEHWALLGLNGSGKTTLLNMINGYFWPSEGSVSVLGHPFGEIDLRELRKSIGWVSTSLQEKLYAAERTQNIVISGKHATIGLYDSIKEEELAFARSLMDQLSCAHLWDREFRTCSQGEKQKLLIARALMAKPRILILDEPCNGLDLFSRERLLASIQELAKSAHAPTLIYVTHHTEEILPVFTHALLIRGGEAVRCGRTEEVLTEEGLSEFFESPVVVEKHRERVYVRMAD
ncbi:molybdenum ABC transporter ATP-binding protein [Paenibacillus selenitireducens]|uniref:Molybdenum ABC transporter ATP-binding protein n=1 Tax=Paenibacillus selenitireducens TaxID=1324314 RepID=A0A1T2WZC8_9BACL|nr:ABC transporter ATP-binding protein [Paenibacillus selenitireducens]OPA72977.1 molybdenum ABC transporter ATP-binding protein [Paenibacillus selenitireducens]